MAVARLGSVLTQSWASLRVCCDSARRTVGEATRLFALGSTVVVAVACDTVTHVRGYLASPGALERLQVGTQNRNDVLRILGTPMTVSSFEDGTWYYITQHNVSFAFLEKRVIEQRVTAIHFGDNNRIRDIKVYDLQDARDPGMNPRVTPTGNKDISKPEKILVDPGRLSPPMN